MKQIDPVPITRDDLLHQVFDQSSAGFQVIDKNWRYLFVNQTVAKQGRSSIDTLLGATMLEKYPGIENTDLFKYMKKSMEEKVAVRMDNEFSFPDGSKGWFQLFIHPWTEGIMIFSIDITERKLAEEKLAERIKHLEKNITSETDKSKLSELQKALEKLREPEVTFL